MGFQDSGIIKAETKWEQELGIDLNNVWWETQYVRPHPVLYSASYKSRSCKWLICPNPDVEDDVITLPVIKVRVSLPFLSRNTYLLRFLKTVLSSQLQLCPLIAVTGTPNEMFALNSKQKQTIAFTTLIARCIVLLLVVGILVLLYPSGLKMSCFFSNFKKLNVHSEAERMFFTNDSFLTSLMLCTS